MGERPGPTTRVRVTEWSNGTVTRHEDRLATEEPLEIRVGWPHSPARRFTVTMRSPGDDFALAVGLAQAEGLLREHDDLVSATYCVARDVTPAQAYNVVTLDLRRPPARWPERALPVSSACGVCGAQSLADVAALAPEPVISATTVSALTVSSLPGLLRRQQRVFERTGGVHAAGAFAADGQPLLVREDVGRHNAVDKVVGQALLDGCDLTAAVLCVSGRLGFEIVQKAAVARMPVVVAVGAPSSLAVALADRCGVTVIGFVRGGRMVAYSHVERLR